jgi:hypothetical protein
MTNLHKKLNNASGHMRLSSDEKRSMRAALSHVMGTESPVVIVRSPYVFFSHTWVRTLAAFVLVVFAGGSTAFAAKGALPGEPLYGFKTAVLEPIQVALAPTPAAKAQVHAGLAQARIEEAEVLAEKGALDATTSTELADAFDAHSHAALAFADAASSTDPSTPAEVEAQLSASSQAGGTVLVALARRNDDKNKEHSEGFAVRLLARGQGSPQAQAFAAAAKTAAPAAVRTMAIATAPTDSHEGTEHGTEAQAAIELQLKAQSALSAAQATASSSANATSSAQVQTALSAVATLLENGSQALKDSNFDAAVKDLSQALAGALRVQALLKAQQTFDIQKDGGHDDGSSDSGHEGSNRLELVF